MHACVLGIGGNRDVYAPSRTILREVVSLSQSGQGFPSVVFAYMLSVEFPMCACAVFDKRREFVQCVHVISSVEDFIYKSQEFSR